MAQPKQKLSDEELNRRERQRTAALSGILEYSVAPSGRALLFPLGGKLYYCDLGKPAAERVTEINHSASSASDATISPAGGYVAFIRDQNLHVYDIAKSQGKALTIDGGGDHQERHGRVRRSGRDGPPAPATGGRRMTAT